MASPQGAHGKGNPSPVNTPAAGREAIRNSPPSHEEAYLCVWGADGGTAKLRKDVAAGHTVDLRLQDVGSIALKDDIGLTNSRNRSGTTAGRRSRPRYDAPETETQARGSAAGSAPRCEHASGARRQLPSAVGFKSFVWHTLSLPPPPLTERQADSAGSSPSSNSRTPLPSYAEVQRLTLEEKVRPNMSCCRVTVSMPARTGFVQTSGGRRPLPASRVAGSGMRKQNIVDNGQVTMVAGEIEKGVCKPETWEGVLWPDSTSYVVEVTAADAAEVILNPAKRGGRGRRRKADRSFIRTKSMSALQRANAFWNEKYRASHHSPPPYNYEESYKDSKRKVKIKTRVARAKVHPSESGSESEPGTEGDYDHWEMSSTFGQYNLSWDT